MVPDCGLCKPHGRVHPEPEQLVVVAEYMGEFFDPPHELLFQERDALGMVAGDHLNDSLLEFLPEFHVPEQDLALITPADRLQDRIGDR